LWVKAVQPVKELHQHFQSFLLISYYRIAQACLLVLHIWFILDPEVILLEGDGVAEEELRGVFEHVWDDILGEILVDETWDIGEHDANVAG